MDVADLVNELIQLGNGFAVDLRGDLYRYEPAAEEEPFAKPAWDAWRRDEELRHAVRLEILDRIAAGKADPSCLLRL